jgi:hypothetical protein
VLSASLSSFSLLFFPFSTLLPALLSSSLSPPPALLEELDTAISLRERELLSSPPHLRGDLASSLSLLSSLRPNLKMALANPTRYRLLFLLPAAVSLGVLLVRVPLSLLSCEF